MTPSRTRSRHQPPPPAGEPVPLPPPAPGRRPTPSAELLQAAAASARLFLLLLVCSLVMAGRPLPWGATSLLFSVPALWVGMRAVRMHRAAASRAGTSLVMSVGLGLAAFVVGGQLLNLVLWPVQWDYERCRAQALTVSALDRCDTERLDRLSPQRLFAGDS